MSEALATYLRDHFAGSRLAIDMLSTLRDRHAGEPLAEFAVELLVDVEQDRLVLMDIIDRVGAGRFILVKEGIAYMIEKLSWLKLRRRLDSGLGTLEALETLALGVQGKRALWRALASVAGEDPRLTGIDFDELTARAEEQVGRIEERRLEFARRALSRSEK